MSGGSWGLAIRGPTVGVLTSERDKADVCDSLDAGVLPDWTFGKAVSLACFRGNCRHDFNGSYVCCIPAEGIGECAICIIKPIVQFIHAIILFYMGWCCVMPGSNIMRFKS